MSLKIKQIVLNRAFIKRQAPHQTRRLEDMIQRFSLSFKIKTKPQSQISLNIKAFITVLALLIMLLQPMLPLLSFSLSTFLQEVLNGLGPVYCGTFFSFLKRDLPLLLLPFVTIATGSCTRGSCVQLGARQAEGSQARTDLIGWLVLCLFANEGCKKILK